MSKTSESWDRGRNVLWAARRFIICLIVLPFAGLACSSLKATFPGLFGNVAGTIVQLFIVAPVPGPGVDADAEWPTNGPYGGPVRFGLRRDPSNPDIVYAASAGGVWKTSDGGATWRRSSRGIKELLEVRAVAVDPLHPNIVYAGLPDTAQPLFRSVDGGATWQAHGADLFDSTINAIAIDPVNPSTIYAASIFALWKSTNGGVNWARSEAGLTGTEILNLAVDPSNPSIVYALTPRRGLFKSTDAGANWAPANAGVPVAPVSNYVLFGGVGFAIDPAAPGTLYAGSYKSLNGGASWSPMNGLPADIRSIAVAPGGAGIVYAADTVAGIYRSSDAGATWSPVNTGLDNLSAWAIALDPRDPARLLVATDFGIAKSVDGGAHWASANTGLANTDVRAVVVDPYAPATLYAATWTNGVFKSVNAGASWTQVYAGPPATTQIMALAIDPHAPRTLYAANFHKSVLKSTDGGATWTKHTAGLQLASSIISLAIDPETPSILYAGTYGNGLYRSADGGATWTQIAKTTFDSIKIHALAVSSAQPKSVWAFVQLINSTFDAFISTDGGASWSTSYPGWTTETLNGGLGLLDFLHRAAGFTSLGGSAYIKQYYDASSCLPVMQLLLDPNDAQLGYAAGACGVGRGRLANGTLTPLPFSTAGPSSLVANWIAITPSGGDLYAGFQWGGVRKRNLLTPPAATVVEYHLALRDQYFITADPVEQAAVDSGAAGPFTRTGGTFAAGGTTPVCRFYGNTNIDPATGGFYGPRSHFYTSDAAECAQLKALFVANAKAWKFESNDFLTTPAVNGQCPANLMPIYRAYNNGFAAGIDSNHRITADPVAYQSQVAKGWIGEGIVMCAPR